MMRRRSDLPPVAPQSWSELVSADSFYARLSRWRDVLVDDEDYTPLYKDSPRGRPSIPPSMVVLAMLLEYSDAEAEQRMRFDLRWKHALGLSLEDGGFDSTLLCRFRRKLLDRGVERKLFERLVNAAREARLITKDVAHLKEIVEDARAALSLVEDALTTPAAAEAASLLENIVSDDVEEGPPPKGPKRRGRPPKREKEKGHPAPQEQDSSSPEDHAPRLRRGVAKDRVLSVVDPQMRVGQKSKRQSWAGYKVHIAEEPQSELITSVEVRPANEYDADAALSVVEQQKESVGLLPKELLCDGAYGSADVRAELGKLGVEVVAKLRPLSDSKHFRKDEFEIDLGANEGKGSVRCPAGVTTTDFRMARDGWYRPVKLFRFPKEVCERCELKESCLGGPNGRVKAPVRQPPGRQVQLHYHEEVLQKARAQQKTPE